MMKSKLIKYFCAVIVCGAFFIPYSMNVSAYYSVQGESADEFVYEEIILDEPCEVVYLDGCACETQGNVSAAQQKTSPKPQETPVKPEQQPPAAKSETASVKYNAAPAPVAVALNAPIVSDPPARKILNNKTILMKRKKLLYKSLLSKSLKHREIPR